MRIGNKVSLAVFYGLIIAIVVAVTYLGSEVTTAVAAMIPLERDQTIVIDPGHGGEDGGATSVTGILESKYNLEIALRLDDLLHLLGYQTALIRKADVSVYTHGATIAQKKVSDLKERVRIVNETENAVLVSIHQNTFSDSKYSGAQVFYGAEGESQSLAESIQTLFVGSINPGSNRKAKAAKGIYLMEHIDCTGVLVECGFLSNSEEEAKLRDSVYQKRLCCVIGSAVSNFLDR